MTDLKDATVKDLNTHLRKVGEKLDTNSSVLVNVISAVEDGIEDILVAFNKKTVVESKAAKEQNKAARENLATTNGLNDATERATDAVTRTAKTYEEFRLKNRSHHIEHINSIDELNRYYEQLQETYKDSSLRDKQLIREDMNNIRQGILARNSERKAVDAFRHETIFATDNIKSWVYKQTKQYGVLTTLFLSLKAFSTELNHSATVGIPLFTGNLGDYIQEIYKTGMSPTDILDMKKKYILGASAFQGGFTQYMKTITDISGDMKAKGLVASKEAGTKLTSALIHAVQTSGVNASDATRIVKDSLMKSFERLHFAVGMTAEEFEEMTLTVSNDAEHRELMMRLSDKERKNYVANIVQQQENLMINKKVTKEQAQAITDFVKKIQGETYKDRLKRGLRTQLTMGMMGVQGGSEMRDAIMAGVNATKEQQALMATKSDELNRAYQSQMGMGGVYELQANVLNEKTGNLLSETTATNTILNDQLKINTQTKGNVEQGFSDVNRLLTDITQGINGIKMSMVGIAAAGLLAKGLQISMSRNMLAKNAAAGATGAATTTAGAAATAGRVGMAARLAPTIGAITPFLGPVAVATLGVLAVGAAGYGMYKIYESIKRKDNAKIVKPTQQERDAALKRLNRPEYNNSRRIDPATILYNQEQAKLKREEEKQQVLAKKQAEETNKSVDKSIELSLETNKLLKVIAESNKKSADLNEEIADNTNEQRKAVRNTRGKGGNAYSSI